MQDYPGDVNPKRERQLIIWPNFHKNCMKMKKIEPSVCGGEGGGGMRPKFVYVDLPLIAITFKVNLWKVGD